MTTPTRLKLVFATLGVAAFFYGVEMQNEQLRWLGIGLVVSAVLLRFWKPNSPAK